ncbi:hypothetical protein [Pyxidicoccus trucidator]|uniref:hypothetical protein n=1 Tax=Pyxidicoccus trucidator TaxID=2709662 RepID=UPI0013DBAED2|nr:hypothetical protein [Pyxidicoccus trucidator]
MRSALPVALLLVLLGASRVSASSVPALEERVRAGYRNATGKMEALNAGPLRASVRTGMLKPPRGYTPLEVVLQNSGPRPLQVRLSFQGHYGTGARTSQRTLEVGPLSRVVAWLPVPAVLQAGNLTVDASGLERMVQPMYLDDGGEASVLVLGTAKDFEAGLGMQETQEEQEPLFAVRFVEERDAPRELSAYVGYSAVVIAGDATQVPADVWAVLEAYAASGGRLLLTRTPRDVKERLPLLPDGASSLPKLYGFGSVSQCSASAACGPLLTGLLSDISGGPVTPIGPPPRWERGNALQGGEQPLLSNARAPVGRFLLLIFAFTLAVGPGGLMLARRRGPVSVLVAVPLVSLVTCLALVAWSVLVDGFSVHAARYSLTWLDGERSRAVTLGVAAWYANLPPDAVKLPASSTLLPPDGSDEAPADLDWTEGLTVTDGFLPPRTYREWGEVAVLPSRARLVVRDEGGALRVQNALGTALEDGYLKRGGVHYRLPALEDGAEGTLGGPVPEAEVPVPSDDLLRNLGEGLYARLLKDKTRFRSDLPEGGFLVRTGGRGMTPTATLKVELDAGVHLVRGQVVEARP